MNADASPAVLQTAPLGRGPWPTIDPFLFCVHHLDEYPRANGSMGPDASLAGRDLGMDFSYRDGWSMYHGTTVPGFPQHPHRGFETVTYVRRGLIDHSDSLGARARFGRGDVQWLTAGAGIVHCEMFPLLDVDGPNTAELFQIWLNLPAVDKMCEPHFTMLWDDTVPKRSLPGPHGSTTELTVVAGTFDDAEPPNPPPHSWASRPEADLAIWHARIPQGGAWDLPPAASDATARAAYVFAGAGLDVEGTEVPSRTVALLRADHRVTLTAPSGDTEVLVLQGRPIGEPVAQQGPFVMNTRDELRQAFEDYRRTGFGGWPWPTDDPVHGHDAGRFAIHPDGRREAPAQ